MTTFEYILMYLGAYLAGFCIGAAILTLAISKPVKKDKSICFEIYEDKSLEKTICFENIVDLNVKPNRKIKLFI